MQHRRIDWTLITQQVLSLLALLVVFDTAVLTGVKITQQVLSLLALLTLCIVVFDTAILTGH